MKKSHDMNAGLERLIESYRQPVKKINTPESFIRLIEAMSDEDAAESKVLRDLYKKINGKQYTKFTPEEQALIDKYGIDAWGFRGDTKLITKGKNDIVKSPYGNNELGHEINTRWGKSWVDSKNADKINLADRIRKTDSRDWGRENAYPYKNPNKRERELQAQEMKQPYNDFKYVKRNYDYAKKSLDDYYNQMPDRLRKADQSYEDEVRNAHSDYYHDTNRAQNEINLNNKRIQDILNKHRKKIESLVRRLSEASMSDEDKNDSRILRNILDKLDKRANARLTPEEQTVLDKYGLTKSSHLIYEPHGQAYSYDYNTRRPEYNLANKIRKDSDSSRDYAREVSRYRGWNDTFQDAEREAAAYDMGSDVSDMKGFLQNRKGAQQALDSASSKRDTRISQAAERRNQEYASITDPSVAQDLRNRLKQRRDNLNDLRTKHGLPTRESLRRSLKEEEERYKRQVTFDACPPGMLGSIIGQMSDGIWENTPSMNGYWMFANELSPGVLGLSTDWYGNRSYGNTSNPYREMSDDEVRRYYANKAKYIAQLWMNDNNINPYRNWRPDNEEECDYFHDGITVADAYEFFTRNR